MCFPWFSVFVGAAAGQFGLAVGLPWLTAAGAVAATLWPVRRSRRYLPLCLLLAGLALLPLQLHTLVGLMYAPPATESILYAALPLPLFLTALLCAVRDEFCRSREAVMFTAFVALLLSLGIGVGLLTGNPIP